MSSKVAVIGAGHVGATIAYTLTVTGAAAEIVLIDINEKKAFGEAMDIRQGTAYCNPSNVYSGTYADAKGADIVIITSGVARKAGQSRLELSQINTDIIKQIAPKITKYAPDAIYVIVANPVDILTYVFTKVSGIPQNRVLGSGTLLDTAVFAPAFRNTTTSARKTFTHTFSASTATPPSFPGRYPPFPA